MQPLADSHPAYRVAQNWQATGCHARELADNCAEDGMHGIEGLDVTTTTARGPTAAEILALLASIERHGSNVPAVQAFKSVLRRKGVEADAAGGPAALEALGDAVAVASPTRADARLAILLAAWGELLPGSGGRARR